MRTHSYKPEKSKSQPIPQQISPDQAKLATPVPPPVQAKTNEEGLAEWKAQQEKWARLGTPWKDKVPNPSGELAQPWIQRKLTLGQPGDKYEQEADRVASQVVQQINAPYSKENNLRQSIQREKDLHGEMQAKCFRAAIQRKQAIADGEASPDLESAINSVRGGGQPLDTGLQQSMGQAMGADFSEVRVHTDTQSDQLNQSIQARAFTTGQDVFFRSGAYQPGNRRGQELIAHELTHVVQQEGHGSEKVGLTAANDKDEAKFSSQKISNIVDPIQRAVTVNNNSLDVGEIEERFNQNEQDWYNPDIHIDIITEMVAGNQQYDFNTDEELFTEVKREIAVKGMQDLKKLPHMKWAGAKARSFDDAKKFNFQFVPFDANCWKAVLYAGYTMGLFSVEKVKALDKGPRGGAPALAGVIKTKNHIIQNDNHLVENQDTIPKGAVVMLGESGEHVMLYIGGGRVLDLDKPNVPVVGDNIFLGIENEQEVELDLNWQKEHLQKLNKELESTNKELKKIGKKKNKKKQSLQIRLAELQADIKMTNARIRALKEAQVKGVELAKKGTGNNQISEKSLKDIAKTYKDKAKVTKLYWAEMSEI